MAQSAQRRKPAAKATKNNPTNSAPQPTLDARPDRLDLRDLPYRAPLRSLPLRWPLDADLKRLLPAYVKAGRILNQGEEGACTGFGLACVTNYLYWLRHLDTPRSKAPPLVSPRMFYELAKLYDEWPGQDYEGSSCRGALKGWHKHGVCRWDLWPYPIDKNNQGVFVRPLPGWEQDAVSRPLGVYYRVDKHSVVDMQAAIHEIGAVYVSGNVHKGWGVDVTGLPSSHADLPRIQRMARSTGGHAFALVGYNEHGFVVQNSWGTDWGASGFAVLSYEDWVTNGSDCWAVALGVPQDLSDLQPAAPRSAKAGKAAQAASGFRVASGAGLSTVGATLRVDDNPRDDPWPFHHDFDHKAYQPLRTAEAYTHTLVSGNDGVLMATDFTRARSDREGLAREIVAERPLAWFKGRKDKTLKLALYAHGGLNSESESIQRIRVLAPYFLANGIYPLFFTWKTGPGETLLDMLEDLGHRIVGGADRSEGVLDQLREAAAEAKDRAIEAVGRQFARGIWTEMRENAAGDAAADHVLDLAARMLRELRSALATSGAQLELHLVGHSAGSILLGHLLDRLGGADVRLRGLGARAAELRGGQRGDVVARLHVDADVGVELVGRRAERLTGEELLAALAVLRADARVHARQEVAVGAPERRAGAAPLVDRGLERRVVLARDRDGLVEREGRAVRGASAGRGRGGLGRRVRGRPPRVVHRGHGARAHPPCSQGRGDHR